MCKRDRVKHVVVLLLFTNISGKLTNKAGVNVHVTWCIRAHFYRGVKVQFSSVTRRFVTWLRYLLSFADIYLSACVKNNRSTFRVFQLLPIEAVAGTVWLFCNVMETKDVSLPFGGTGSLPPSVTKLTCSKLAGRRQRSLKLNLMAAHCWEFCFISECVWLWSI